MAHHAARPTYAFCTGTPADAEAFADVFTRAFRDNEIMQAMFPGILADLDGCREFNWKDHLRDIEDPHVEWGTVRRVDTDEVVAVGKWELCSGEHKDRGGDKAEGAELVWEGEDEVFHKNVLRLGDERRQIIMGTRAHYAIRLLGTLPEHQGRGAMSVVLHHIIARGAERNIPLYLEATSAGFPVYVHFGFKQVDVIDVELPRGGRVEMPQMVREVVDGSRLE